MSVDVPRAAPGAFRTMLRWLDDSVLGLLVVLFFPVAIILIGLPIALFARMILAIIHRL